MGAHISHIFCQCNQQVEQQIQRRRIYFGSLYRVFWFMASDSTVSRSVVTITTELL